MKFGNFTGTRGIEYYKQRNKKSFLCLLLALSLVIVQLAAIPFPVRATTYNLDPGLNSGNAVVDRSTVPGQTILKYQTTGSSTFTAPVGVTNVRVLVVGGGGSGGNNHGGGGGAGELYHNTSFAVTPGSSLAVNVGARGAAQTTNGIPGNDGGDSTFGTVTVNGGGGGGSRDGGASTGPGKPGGSGGGGAGNTNGVDTRAGGASVKTAGGLGNAGGTGDATIFLQAGNGGGGGGASSAGANATPAQGGSGGAGVSSDISGTVAGYAGGGGGNGWTGNSTAGTASHGGGAGSPGGSNQAGVAATANTGGGGGGGGPAFGDGGAGGSGVVIVRFTTVKYGVEVQAADNLTGEDGDTGSFKVRLSTQPTAAVTVQLSSTDTDEGTVPASITIQPEDWNNFDANVVTVTGINDSPAAADGAVAYTVTTGEVTSADTNFDVLIGSDVDDVSMFNLNDDPPGINAFVVGSNKTTESGDCATVRFELLSLPSASVTVPLSISDGAEGTLNGVTQLVIAPVNWNQPQNNEVTVCGVDDSTSDGDILYHLVPGNPTSGDAGYDALTAGDMPQLALINVGGDSDGIAAATELAAPNNGDGNNDGAPDHTQSNVASFVNSITGEYAVLEADSVCEITIVGTVTESSQSAIDADYNYPHGLMSFILDCGTPGYMATVRQYYYGASGTSVVRKFNSDTNTYATISGATAEQVAMGGEVAGLATYQITDGGALDMDAVANGTIVDPAGLAVSLSGSPTSSGEGADSELAGTGSNTWAYTVLAVLLIVGSTGILVWRKKHPTGL